MEQIFALVAVAVVVALIVALRWPGFTRDRRGGARALSIAALLVFVCAGLAQGADAPAPWPLIGLVVGVALYLAAAFLAARQGRSTSSAGSADAPRR